MMYSLIILLLTMIVNISFGEPGFKMNVKYEFKYVNFTSKSWKMLDYKMDYNASKIILFDVDEAPDGRTFVTAVRDKGVPASVMTVSDERGPGGPLLIPYPNWAWYNDTTDCDNNIISVLRIFIKCNRLFVLDFGIKDGFEGERICPQKLLIFNLNNDILVKRIHIPLHIANNKNGTGLLATVVADVRDCRHIDAASIYMADVAGYGLVTYDGSHSSFCRIESDFMKPTHPNFTIENENFYLEDGIVGLTIINENLFYAPLAGNRIFKMNKHALRRCPLSNSKANRITQVAGTLSGQTGPIASKDNVIFFSNIPETSILCADTTKKFDPSNSTIIAKDSETLQFPSGMKVIGHKERKVRRHKEGKILIATNKLQRVFNNSLNTNETNFRILSIDIEEIVKNTNLFAPNHHGHKPGH